MSRTNPSIPTAECPLIGREWLMPIEPDSPCGADLEYDRAFILLMDQVMPKADVQYGAFVETPPPINWSVIERDCRQLMERTKDMRLALLFTRCRVRFGGIAGLAEGLGLLAAWLQAFPRTLHPCTAEEGDAIRHIRRNVLQGLSDPEGLLADVRESVLVRAAGASLYWRDVEQALGTRGAVDEAVRDRVRQQLASLKVHQPAIWTARERAARYLADIDAWSDAQLGADGLNLSALRALLDLPIVFDLPHTLDAAVQNEVGGTVGDAGHFAAIEGQLALPDAMAEPAPPLDRESVRVLLRKIREWFEVHEPSSPIAILLTRAERCIGMRYVELAQVLPPDLVAGWEEQNASA